jgi:hypothetical protein
MASTVKSRKLGVVPNGQRAEDIPLEGMLRGPKLPRTILAQQFAVIDLRKDTCRRCVCTGHMTVRTPVAASGHLMQQRSNQP